MKLLTKEQVDALTGFTEGPWIADFDEAIKAKAKDGTVATVSTVITTKRRSMPEVTGNGYLIAAAPDLHATCLALFAEVERYKKALETYADPESYRPHPHGIAFDRRDLSYIARAALKGPSEYERKVAQMKEDFPNGI